MVAAQMDSNNVGEYKGPSQESRGCSCPKSKLASTKVTRIVTSTSVYFLYNNHSSQTTGAVNLGFVATNTCRRQPARGEIYATARQDVLSIYIHNLITTFQILDKQSTWLPVLIYHNT